MFDIAVFGSLFLTLFVIMDPPGITPIFLALTAGRPGKVQKRMAFQAVCVACGVITGAGAGTAMRQQSFDRDVATESSEIHDHPEQRCNRTAHHDHRSIWR